MSECFNIYPFRLKRVVSFSNIATFRGTRNISTEGGEADLLLKQ